MRNFDNRLARLEQVNTAAMDPPTGLTAETIAFGLRSRCLIVDLAGDFRPYLPDFPDPYWMNVTTWLNHFKGKMDVTADQLTEELLSNEPKL